MKIYSPMLVFAVALAIVVVCTSSPSSAQYLFNHASFATGTGPTEVAFADFNGDGRDDIVVTNSDDNTVSIIMGRANGTFAPKVDYATGSLPVAVAVADFNKDGKIDLAVVNANGGTVSVLLGNGDGTFQTHVDYPVGNSPIGVVAAIFTTSKTLDLAVANYNDSTVSILLGNGDGTFQTQTLESVAPQPQSFTSGDFNHDGRIDLITASADPGTVSVLLSNGDGTFKRLDSPSGYSGPDATTVITGLFNSDKKLDAVVSSSDSGQLYLLAGNGDGTFNSPVPLLNLPYAPVTVVIAGDFNHDGHLDLAAGDGNIVVLLGKGDGTFGKPTISPYGETDSLAAVDFNRDGWLDLAIVDASSQSVVALLGQGNGVFAPPNTVALPSDAYGVNSSVVADFNGDGKPDLAVAEIGFPNGQVAVQLGRGDGTFGKPIVSQLAGNNNDDLVVAGDFNGDKKLDLLIRDDYATGFAVSFGNGDGTFGTTFNTPLSYTVQGLAAGDFDGDGKTDVAVTSYASGGQGHLNIFLSNGDGTFRAGNQYVVSTYLTVAAADVNHDGKMDLIIASPNSALLVFLGNGDGTFQAPINGPTAVYYSNLVFADFNNDGQLDIAVGTYSGIGFLAGKGDGNFADPVYSNDSLMICCQLATGDFNGDGKPDLATAGGTNAIEIMVGNGDGTFGSLTGYGTFGEVVDMDIGDFNSDGVSDMALAYQDLSTEANRVALYLSTPTVNLPRSAINFGNEPVGKTSVPHKISLINTGNSGLKIVSITPAGDFLETNNCGKERQIGKSCTIQVSFKPKEKGLRTGKLTVTDNAKGSPQEVRLKGTGD